MELAGTVVAEARCVPTHGPPPPGPALAVAASGGRRSWAAISEAEGIVRLAHLQVGRWRRASAAEQRSVAEEVAVDVTGLQLAEARRHIRPRQWILVALHMGGWSYQRIADAVGYSQPCAVRAVILRPAVQRFIRRVREHQLEQIVSGTFGVVAAARAAAPRVVEHVCELAGARLEADGTRRGRAARDGDCLRAGALVLGLAGHTSVRRTDPCEYPWLEECSDRELEVFATSGVVPARYATVAGLAAATPRPAACIVGADPADAMLHTALVPARSPPVLAGDGRGRRARARARGRPGEGA